MASWLALAIFLAMTFATGAIGGIASVNAREFYAGLSRPEWSPPGWIFGPVWTTLYILMAVAAWLVWRERGWSGASVAITLFVVQLVVNALWSWIFFAWHRGALAVADVVLLAALIVATMIAFAGVRALAAWLLAPYLAWVCFASALTFAVWRRNPGVL